MVCYQSGENCESINYGEGFSIRGGNKNPLPSFHSKNYLTSGNGDSIASHAFSFNNIPRKCCSRSKKQQFLRIKSNHTVKISLCPSIIDLEFCNTLRKCYIIYKFQSCKKEDNILDTFRLTWTSFQNKISREVHRPKRRVVLGKSEE